MYIPLWIIKYHTISDTQNFTTQGDLTLLA